MFALCQPAVGTILDTRMDVLINWFRVAGGVTMGYPSSEVSLGSPEDLCNPGGEQEFRIHISEVDNHFGCIPSVCCLGPKHSKAICPH